MPVSITLTLVHLRRRQSERFRTKCSTYVYYFGVRFVNTLSNAKAGAQAISGRLSVACES